MEIRSNRAQYIRCNYLLCVSLIPYIAARTDRTAREGTRACCSPRTHPPRAVDYLASAYTADGPSSDIYSYRVRIMSSSSSSVLMLSGADIGVTLDSLSAQNIVRSSERRVGS